MIRPYINIQNNLYNEKSIRENEQPLKLKRVKVEVIQYPNSQQQQYLPQQQPSFFSKGIQIFSTCGFSNYVKLEPQSPIMVKQEEQSQQKIGIERINRHNSFSANTQASDNDFDQDCSNLYSNYNSSSNLFQSRLNTNSCNQIPQEKIENDDQEEVSSNTLTSSINNNNSENMTSSNGQKRKYRKNPNRVYKNYEGKVFHCNNQDCQFQTLNRTSYYNHIKHAHQTEIEYKCKDCNYKSMNKRNLNQHIAYCHIDTVLECPECGKKNLNKYSLKKHMKEVHCEKSFKCTECVTTKWFKSKSSLNKHLSNVHSNNTYNCEYCKYTTKCQQYLKEHIKNRHTLQDTKKSAKQVTQCIVLN